MPFRFTRAFLMGLALCVAAGPGAAQSSAPADLSEAEILNRLRAQALKSQSRGFGVRQDAEDATAEPEYTPVDDNLRVDITIAFDHNSSDLRPDQAPRLEQLCGALQQLPDLRFQLVGHTDASGAADYNKTLSEKRADAVRGHLASDCGIEQNRLSAMGQGEEALLDAANPRSAANRRVEIQVSG